jgi:hypothetical protein
MTDDDNSDDDNSIERRGLLAGLAGLGAAGVFATGRASAQSTPDGELGTTATPDLRAHVDRIRFVPRTSDVSTAPDGTIWFRGDV